jgi:predicted DNA binding CopG/RHH family protein
MNLDIEKLTELLKEYDLLEKIQGKRLTTQETPGILYIKLVLASEATRKPLSACISTALETYTMRNEEKHLDECRLKAAAEGLPLEEWLAKILKKRADG